MEDAMIINKSAYERGFGHASIYKSEFIDLKISGSYFCRDPNKEHLSTWLDDDGLPYIGNRLVAECPFYWYISITYILNSLAKNMLTYCLLHVYTYLIFSYMDISDGNYKTVKFHGKEECYVENVKQCGDFQNSTKSPKKICITIRIPVSKK